MTSTKKGKMKDISNKILSSRLQTETKDILNLFFTLFSTLQENQSVIDGQEKKMESMQAECNKNVSALKNNQTQLEAKCEQLPASHSKSIQSIQSGADNNEQYERRDTLILFGQSLPQETDNENFKQIVRNLIQKHLRLNLNPTDVSIAHRFGWKPSYSTTKRNIVLKYVEGIWLEKFFQSAKQQFTNTATK